MSSNGGFISHLIYLVQLSYLGKMAKLTNGKFCLIQLLQQETPDFIGPDLWPPNSPDLNPVDYKIWGVMQQRVYKYRVSNVNELKQRLVEVWHDLQQNVIDSAVSEWRKRLRTCVRAEGRHFEHLLRACLTGTWIGRTYF